MENLPFSFDLRNLHPVEEGLSVLLSRRLALLRVSDASVVWVEVDHAATDDGCDRGADHRAAIKWSVATLGF
jgi:hypothetical protein